MNISRNVIMPKAYHIIILCASLLLIPSISMGQRTSGPQSSPAPLNITDGTTSCFPFKLDVSSGTLACSSGVATLTTGGGSNITIAPVPINPTIPCTPTTFAYDSTFFYVCSSTNTWVRTALATWTPPVTGGYLLFNNINLTFGGSRLTFNP